MNIPGQIITEVKKAVERGPIYVLVFAGAVLLVGVDPAEFYAPSRHILSPAEFMTVNIVAGTLIIAAASLGVLSSLAAMRALEQISAKSSDANVKAMEILKGIQADNAVLQSQIATHVLDLSQQASGQFNTTDGARQQTSQLPNPPTA